VVKFVIFELFQQFSLFIPRVFVSQFIKISKNKTIVGNIYRQNTAPFVDVKMFNHTSSEIFLNLKKENKFKNAHNINLLADVYINLLNLHDIPIQVYT